MADMKRRAPELCAQIKICSKCQSAKPLDQFPKSKKGLYGRRSDCSICHRAAVKAIRERRHRASGRPSLGAPMRCAVCDQECLRVNPNQKYCGPCAKEVERQMWAAANKRYTENNPDARRRGREAQERYRQRNLERVREYARVRSKKPEVMARANDRGRQLRKRPEWAIHYRMSAGIRTAVRERKAGRRWESLVGYSLQDLLVHLERQFLPGMSWENISEWEIDHIIPRSSFSFEDESSAEFRACWALTNLRPLWSQANRHKSGKRLFLI